MDALKTLDPQTYEPPKSRIGTASQASNFMFRLVENDNLRSIHRTKIKGQYDGNAPYNKNELIAKGMGANCNLNFRQAAAIIDQFKTPYYDLVVEVPYIADIQTASGTSTERGDWSQIITEEFHRMVTGWDDWDFIEQYHQFQMLLSAVAVPYFHDKMDWRPDVAKAGEILVPDGTRCRMDELEIVVILKNYASHQLYRYIRNKEQATQVGWNVLATEKAIIDAYSSSDQPPTDANNYEWYQQKLKNADLYYGTSESKDVYVAHELVKEFDERVSHHMVRADRTSDEFLYTNIGRFDSMNEVICPFFYDIGDGTWHSVNSLGKDIYAYCEIFNRLRCREVDGAMIAASVLLQSNSADSVTKAQLVTLSNLSILPPNLSVASTNIGQGIEATTGVRRDMEAGLYQNIGSMQRAPGSTQPRKGQKQAVMEMQQSAQLGKGKINRYYSARDRYLYQIYRRASNPNLRPHHPGAREALDFQNRCFRRGVSKEALVEIDSVKAMRSIGAGSAINAIMVTEALMEHAGSFPEEGRQLAIRDWVSRMAGGHAADRYMGEIKTSRSTEDDSIAGLENAALRTGSQDIVITMQQSHVRHLESHLGDMEKHYQQVQDQAAQQGMDIKALQALFIHLDASGKHCQKHLEAIKNDPIRAEDFKKLFKLWQQMAQLQDQVKQQLEEMMQKEAEQQQQNGSPIQPADAVKLLGNKDLAETTKQHLTQILGIPLQPGDTSVSHQNLIVKDQQLALKAEKQKRDGVIDDVELSQKTEKHQQDMSGENNSGQ